MNRWIMPIGAALLALSGSAAFAGAGANMYGCVYLPVIPAQDITFNFNTKSAGNHCMNDTGHNASITVGKAGVSCVALGYVEEKGSSSGGDTCATDHSTWVLSYNSDPGGYSGTVQTHMFHSAMGDNHLGINNSSPGTFICTTENLCTDTAQAWDSGTVGPFYMIFRPGPHE